MPGQQSLTQVMGFRVYESSLEMDLLPAVQCATCNRSVFFPTLRFLKQGGSNWKLCDFDEKRNFITMFRIRPLDWGA